MPGETVHLITLFADAKLFYIVTTEYNCKLIQGYITTMNKKWQLKWHSGLFLVTFAWYKLIFNMWTMFQYFWNKKQKFWCRNPRPGFVAQLRKYICVSYLAPADRMWFCVFCEWFLRKLTKLYLKKTYWINRVCHMALMLPNIQHYDCVGTILATNTAC